MDAGGEDVRAPWDKAGIHGVHRPREWDDVVAVETDLPGDRARFVALAEQIVIEEGPDDVEALADAVTLEPPFRAEGRPTGGGLWSVGARQIQVVDLPGLAGEELQLASHAGVRELTVDGEQVFGSIPSLEREGDYVVRGRHLAGDLWEVETSLL
jgi:hypothetical protein